MSEIIIRLKEVVTDAGQKAADALTHEAAQVHLVSLEEEELGLAQMNLDGLESTLAETLAAYTRAKAKSEDVDRVQTAVDAARRTRDGLKHRVACAKAAHAKAAQAAKSAKSEAKMAGEAYDKEWRQAKGEELEAMHLAAIVELSQAQANLRNFRGSMPSDKETEQALGARGFRVSTAPITEWNNIFTVGEIAPL
jgi:hypothetical protein